jgi:hypothetical protein
MLVKVHMLAFGEENEVRFVEIGPAEYNISSLLEQVFHWGQNDFQPQQHPSVSVGDVAEVDGKFYLCKAMGWKELDKLDLIAYRAIPRRDRAFHALLD